MDMPMTHNFRVGDRIKGTAEASRHYHITNSRWVGFVCDVNGKRIRVCANRDDHRNSWWVDAAYFDFYAEDNDLPEEAFDRFDDSDLLDLIKN